MDWVGGGNVKANMWIGKFIVNGFTESGIVFIDCDVKKDDGDIENKAGEFESRMNGLDKSEEGN